jgi:hypothetical protein
VNTNLNTKNNIVEYKEKQSYNNIVNHCLLCYKEDKYYNWKNSSKDLDNRIYIFIVGRGSGAIANATEIKNVKIVADCKEAQYPSFNPPTKTETKIIKFMQANPNKLYFMILNFIDRTKLINYLKKLSFAEETKFILFFNDSLLKINNLNLTNLQNISQRNNVILIPPKFVNFNSVDNLIYNNSLDNFAINPIDVISSLWALVNKNKAMVIQYFQNILDTLNTLPSKYTDSLYIEFKNNDINFLFHCYDSKTELDEYISN